MVSTRRRAAQEEASDSDSDAPEEVSLKSSKQQAIAQKQDERIAKHTASAAKKERGKRLTAGSTNVEAEAVTAQGEQEPELQVLEPPPQKGKKAKEVVVQVPAQVPNEPEEDLLPEDLLVALEQQKAEQQAHKQLQANTGAAPKLSKGQARKLKLREVKQGVVTVKVLGKRLEGTAVHTNPLSEMLMQRKRSYDMLLPAKHLSRPSKKFV